MKNRIRRKRKIVRFLRRRRFFLFFVSPRLRVGIITSTNYRRKMNDETRETAIYSQSTNAKKRRRVSRKKPTAKYARSSASFCENVGTSKCIRENGECRSYVKLQKQFVSCARKDVSTTFGRHSNLTPARRSPPVSKAIYL